MRYLLLLLLTYSNLGLALGFGEVSLKSHLGEPLLAKINVTDVEMSPKSSCFNVTDASDAPAFKNASISLIPNASGYLLTISTHNIITEPIVNLNVLYHCNPEFSREYVLLLDPVIQAEVAVNTPYTSPANQAAVNLAISAKQSSTESDTELARTLAKVPFKPKRAQKKKAKPSNINPIDSKLAEAYTGKQAAASNESTASMIESKISPKSSQQPSASKPYLIISSGDINSSEHGSLPSLALRLETQIDFTRVASTVPLTNTDAMDEVTVMANRLAHLEKQVISLQAKNVQLMNESVLAKNMLAEQKSRWLQNLSIAIGLIVLLATANWLRRKVMRNRLHKEQDQWFEAEYNADAKDETTDLPASKTSATKANIFDDSFFDQPSYGQPQGYGSFLSNPTSIEDEASDDHENILENADVFIEHGRPALAIQLLQNHLSDFPSESPKIWLKLLKLIAAEGSKSEYEQAVSDCAQYFNIKLPSFAESIDEDCSSIEDFQNIVARLQGIWGSPFALSFLNDLIYNKQSQPIEGFPPSTFEDLFFLKQMAELLSTNNVKEQELYPPTIIKPALDNLAFNEATFGGDRLLNDSQVSYGEISGGSELIQSEVVDSQARQATTPQKLNPVIESSPFQTIPSYEVDVLFGFDDEKSFQEFSDAADESNLATSSSLLKVESSINEQAVNNQDMDFLLPTQELEVKLSVNSTLNSAIDADDKDITQKANKMNEIEWKLPNE